MTDEAKAALIAFGALVHYAISLMDWLLLGNTVSGLATSMVLLAIAGVTIDRAFR